MSSSKPPPKPPVVVPSGAGNNIIINSNQRLNPLLEAIRNVGKEFGDIVPDFQVGRTTCVLYLSLKYHRLHPEYILGRIERLGNNYNLRILLILCDISEHQDPVRELTKSCLINNITIVVAWTVDEAGLYLSTFKQYEHKSPDLIKERVDKDYSSLLRSALTGISRVNKTDVEILRTNLGSFADIARTPADKLRTLPGFGQVKVKKLKDAFEKPFRNAATSTLPPGFVAAISVLPDQDLEVSPNSTATSKNATTAKFKTRPLRSPSPVWDIELDLNPEELGLEYELSENGPPPVSVGKALMSPKEKARSLSPMWDIELELNENDAEVAGTFGKPSLL